MHHILLHYFGKNFVSNWIRFASSLDLFSNFIFVSLSSWIVEIFGTNLLKWIAPSSAKCKKVNLMSKWKKRKKKPNIISYLEFQMEKAFTEPNWYCVCVWMCVLDINSPWNLIQSFWNESFKNDGHLFQYVKHQMDYGRNVTKPYKILMNQEIWPVYLSTVWIV